MASDRPKPDANPGPPGGGGSEEDLTCGLDDPALMRSTSDQRQGEPPKFIGDFRRGILADSDD